jgi:hypothetical protein
MQPDGGGEGRFKAFKAFNRCALFSQAGAPNSKSETRNPKQTEANRIGKLKTQAESFLFENFRIRSFEIVSDFEFRTSDLPFEGLGSPHH